MNVRRTRLAVSLGFSGALVLKVACERPHLLRKMRFAGLVAFGGAIRPDPIPNSAVKRFCANGTMSQDLGE